MPYRILYSEKVLKKYPLIIFFHGSGERGIENERQLMHGSEWLAKNINQMGGIVIFPQCATNDYWANVEITTDAEGRKYYTFGQLPPTKAMKCAISLIDSMSMQPYVDNERIYLIGLSMGGMACFELMWRRPGIFAAAVPICGGGDTSMAPAIAETKAIWIFHGDKDESIPVAFSREMYRELIALSKNVKYTEYQGIGHDAWENVFKEAGFFEWMLRQNL